jgi:hypothetical protein
MKTMSMGLALAVVVAGVWLLAAGQVAPAGGMPPAGRGAPATQTAEVEVSRRPSLLVSPAIRVGDLTVHGIRLGDPVEKLDGNPAFTRQDVPERPQDIFYTGRDAWCFATEGTIYRIRVRGEIVRKMPAYNAARLQVALGKADAVTESRDGEEKIVSFFARRVEYTVRADRGGSVVTDVDLYAP